jgi:DNA-binding IclR family transcriptional regulator
MCFIIIPENIENEEKRMVKYEFQFLLENGVARDVLLDIVRAHARTTTQISADLRIPHKEVRKVLNELEKEGFVESQPLGGLPTSASALYSATKKGVLAARSLRAIVRQFRQKAF